MTREELCIHACKYAIGELTRKGSSAFITSAHEGRQQITWVEVMEWLNREQQPEDAISRQDTLKTIIKHLGIRSEEYLLPAEEAIYKVVKNMPPIQPEPTECEDTISRQGLIDFLKGFEILHCNDELRTNLLNGINSLSPVYPKIKIGHWIHLKHNKGKCSECHDVVLIAQMYGNANYCPNCGAKMIEPQESKGKE